MKKFINDMFKTPSGKYSRKSFIIFITFVTIILLAIFIAISDKVLDREVNRYVIQIFDSLLIFLATLLGISVFDKKVVNKTEPINNQDI